MKNLKLKNLIVLLLFSISVNAQCYILFEKKIIETANDSFEYNGLTGKIVNSGHFGNFDEDAFSYIEFVNVEKDSLILLPNSVIDSTSSNLDSSFVKYRITKLLGYETNNKLPYSVMSGLYSTDVSIFYSNIYMVGKYNTRNGKLYPFKILPLPEQVFILKYFNITKAQATVIWNQIKNELD